MASSTNVVAVPGTGLWTLLGTPAAGKNMVVELASGSAVDPASGIEWGIAAAVGDLLGLPGHKMNFKSRQETIFSPGGSVFARRTGGVVGAVVNVTVTITL